MNSTKIILFLVDHKHRDLPSLSLIGFFLQNKGYDVKYIALSHTHFDHSGSASKLPKAIWIAMPAPLFVDPPMLFPFHITIIGIIG